MPEVEEDPSVCFFHPERGEFQERYEWSSTFTCGLGQFCFGVDQVWGQRLGRCNVCDVVLSGWIIRQFFADKAHQQFGLFKWDVSRSAGIAQLLSHQTFLVVVVLESSIGC